MRKAYERARQHSDGKLQGLRDALATVVPKGAMAVTFGSYARREASTESDIDYIVIANEGGGQELEHMGAIEKKVGEIVPIEPSEDGAFAKLVLRSDMLKNLGGQNDTNQTLTRRLLLLLEGEWLTDSSEFQTFRQELLTIYVRATRRDHQLALFLLNDIIRYWRTMTVDYMYKTTEGQKPWAIRNIKLTFSRKLLYASGVFSVGMTADRSEEAKVDILEHLFSLPVIDRMIDICGASRAEKVLESYDMFLENLEKPKVRDELKVIKSGDHGNIIFRKLKNEGHHFTRSLMSLFEETFHSTHPIRRAVMF